MSNICLLCSSQEVTKEAYGMRRCRQCRFFFLAPEIRQEQQATFHQQSQQAVDPEYLLMLKKKYPKGSHLKRALYQTYAKRAKEWYGVSFTVLDVGACGGFFLNELERLGIPALQLDSCEVTPTYIALTKEYFGYSGGIGNIEDYQPGKTYDLVTMFDVLEHVDDFKRALKNIHSLLNPGGRLLLKLPNGRWSYLKYKVASWLGLSNKIPVYLHIRPGGHLNYWDVNTVPRLLENHYSLESFEYVEPTKVQFRRTYVFRFIAYWLNEFSGAHLFPEMIVVLRKK